MCGRGILAFIVSCVVAGASLLSGSGGVQATTGAGDQAVAYQINLAHSGDLSGDALTPPLTKQWSVNLGGPISYPLVAGAMVFVTVGNVATPNNSPNYGSTLYALDERTGNAVWSVALGGTYYWSAAAYDAGDVFVVNGDGLLRALAASSGSLLWSAQLSGQWSFTSPPVASNGTVYLSGAGSGGTLYAVSESTGAVLWTQPVANGDESSPALSGSSVYVSYAGPQTYDFTTAGAPVWHYNSGIEGGGGSTGVLNGGDLYVRDAIAPAQGDVLDGATGQLVNTFTASGPPAFSGNIGAFLYGASSSSGGTLQLQDWTNPSSPTTVWSFAGDGTLDSAPIIVNNDVYVGGSSGNLYALDLTTHQQVWSTNVGAGIPLSNDAAGSSVPTTGLGAGEGHLIVPAGTLLVAYSMAQAPTVAGTSFSATEGSAFTGTMATFTDPNPAPSGDTATIVWGDGTTSPGTVASNGSGGYTVSGSHTYSEEGSLTPNVTVSNGALSSSAADSASVADASLLSFGYALNGTSTNTSFTQRVLTFSDNDPGCAPGDYSATVAWGDGTTSTGVISAGSSACSENVTGTHTYASPGSYTIVTRVRDASGSTTSNNSSISVKRHR